MRRCGLAKRKNVEGGRKRAYIHELASLPTIALFHERKTSFSGHGLLILLISRVSFLLATGSRLGKGFDNTRLVTPFLAMPGSRRGTLRQHGRPLHRLHENKREVQVYDYAGV
jgi:hypothetical protein